MGTRTTRILKYVTFRRLWNDDDLRRGGYKDKWYVSDILRDTREEAESAMRRRGEKDYVIQEVWIEVPESIQGKEMMA